MAINNEADKRQVMNPLIAGTEYFLAGGLVNCNQGWML